MKIKLQFRLLAVLSLLLLPLLVNPAPVNAKGTGKVVPSESNPLGNAASLNAGTKMGPIAAGAYHTCALTTTGGVKCWGADGEGELGDNSIGGYSPIPVNVTGLSSGVSAITAGGSHTCALTTTGGVKCWGRNFYGELGNNSTTNSPVPVDVWGLSSGVSAITAGINHTCALATTGGMKCWGNNLFGQLGNNSTTDSHIPVDVWGLSSGVSAIAAGGFHSCALTITGGAKCWGFDVSGALGDNGGPNSSVPVDVWGLSSGVSAIAAGEQHTCALTTTGGVKCWGFNTSGQVGINSSYPWRILIPADVIGLSSDVSAISAIYDHTCALTIAGGVKCWGDNFYGQLGNHSNTNSPIPADVSGLSSGASTIVAGQWHTCALTTAGGMKCWGDNEDGQLGNNSLIASNIPVDVVGFGSSLVVNSIIRANPNPTNAASVNFTVTFSEDVTGVDVTDFNLTVTGLTGASVTGVSGSGTTYTVTAGTGTGNGTLRLDVTDDDSIIDGVGNPLGGAGAGNGDFTSGEAYKVNKTYRIYLPLVIR